MSLAVTCALGASTERRTLIQRQVAGSLFGVAIDLLGAHACDRFADMAPARAQPPAIKSEVPLLLLSAGLDPRAPASNVEQLLPGLPNARHVVLPGVSHDFGAARDAELELAYRFLASGIVPPPRRLREFAFTPLR
jgi:pimeloyl-ACP methyl ester carboxylesterase